MLAWQETLYYHAIATAVYAEAVGRTLGIKGKNCFFSLFLVRDNVSIVRAFYSTANFL